MAKKNFLEQKYCEINQLKNLLQTYPKEYCETIIKVMEKVFDEITEYIEKEKDKVKDMVKKAQNKRVFTEKELAKYNGRNGEKSYIAVNGIVYDVTNVPKWRGGNHYGVKAGQVLDKEFLQCHLGKSDILEKAVPVGGLEKNTKSESNKKKYKSNRSELKQYKLEDISKFDGRDGTLAYVVVDGIVYDVTSINQWRDGNHYGLVAGKDLTEYFNSCHNGKVEMLKRVAPIVGYIL